MLWYILRITMSFAFPVFYRRMQIRNASRIREKGPMFIAMNHPNAFMDPMTFSWLIFYPRTRYMARGDAFKKGFAAWALQSMGIVPIYRLRDGGYESVKKNLDSFNIAYDLLDKDQKIMVFAEGVCVQERRLRPVQKGTAKMAFAYLDRGGNENLKIIPAGLHYSTPAKFGGDVLMQIGEPIWVKDHYEAYKKEPAKTIVKLTTLIEEKMRVLVPGLTHKENDKVLEQLQQILKEQYLEEHGLDKRDLGQHEKYWVFIMDRLNELTEKDPARIEAFRKEVDAYTLELEKLKIEDSQVRLASQNKRQLTLLNIILGVVGFPFYVIGKVLNLPAYYLSKKIADKTTKTVEFHASVNFGSWALMAKLFFIVELLILWLIFNNIYILLSYALVKISTGLVAWRYSRFKNKMLGAMRLRKIKRAHLPFYEDLLKTRRKIVAFVNEKP